MIENNNASKLPSTKEIVDIKKFIGVASVNVLAVNPKNDKLRTFGWRVPEDAKEPEYVTTTSDGKRSARVRFLVQVQDLDDKPVIALDFWIRPEVMVNKDASKAKIIDSFGRTAWGTKQEIQAHQIPQYSKSLAQISSDYKLCHVGEEELITFLMKYLNVTPLRTYSSKTDEWIPSKNPGRLTIDHWDWLCNGNVSELADYLSREPENRVKVILGVRNTDDNKTYQTFLSDTFIGNGALPDKHTGEYVTARKAIDRYFEGRRNSPYSFSAKPIQEWGVSATNVKDNTENEDLPDFSSPAYTVQDPSDLPFEM